MSISMSVIFVLISILFRNLGLSKWPFVITTILSSYCKSKNVIYNYFD